MTLARSKRVKTVLERERETMRGTFTNHRHRDNIIISSGETRKQQQPLDGVSEQTGCRY